MKKIARIENKEACEIIHQTGWMKYGTQAFTQTYKQFIDPIYPSLLRVRRQRISRSARTASDRQRLDSAQYSLVVLQLQLPRIRRAVAVTRMRRHAQNRRLAGARSAGAAISKRRGDGAGDEGSREPSLRRERRRQRFQLAHAAREVVVRGGVQ